MRVKTLQIVWHGKEPVFSVDFHADGVLATAGADKDIKVHILYALPPPPPIPTSNPVNVLHSELG